MQNARRPPATPAVPADPQQDLRELVWARFREVARPDSRFHWDFSSFIADFAGSEDCVDRVRALPAWSRSPLLFITPDNSTELIRRAAMADGKPFLMTTYGIRRGFLALDPGDVPAAERSYAATLDGMDRYARPVDLGEISRGERIGLLITGGSAVNRSGHRMGKGHGYFDLEWALLSEIGAVDSSSEIADIVHDCQVVDVVVDAGGTRRARRMDHHADPDGACRHPRPRARPGLLGSPARDRAGEHPPGRGACRPPGPGAAPGLRARSQRSNRRRTVMSHAAPDAASEAAASQTSDRVFAIEQRGIDIVGAEERHGRPRDLFWMWLGSNLNVFYPVNGALVIYFGLSFAQAVIAIIIGNLIFFAVGLTSLQGPASAPPRSP